jgi:hypothetical protein
VPSSVSLPEVMEIAFLTSLTICSNGTKAPDRSTGSPTSPSTTRCDRRDPACQSRVNQFERSSLLTELQGSLILVNFSVLPGRLKVYFPGLLHVTGEPDGTAA